LRLTPEQPGLNIFGRSLIGVNVVVGGASFTYGLAYLSHMIADGLEVNL
jgi:hypothetical protein